jgi:hypothetical protein
MLLRVGRAEFVVSIGCFVHLIARCDGGCLLASIRPISADFFYSYYCVFGWRKLSDLAISAVLKKITLNLSVGFG